MALLQVSSIEMFLLLMSQLLLNGQRVQMTIGVSSGSTSIGLIGKDGLTFLATGEPVETAKALADCGDALLVGWKS